MKDQPIVDQMFKECVDKLIKEYGEDGIPPMRGVCTKSYRKMYNMTVCISHDHLDNFTVTIDFGDTFGNSYTKCVYSADSLNNILMPEHDPYNILQKAKEVDLLIKMDVFRLSTVAEVLHNFKFDYIMMKNCVERANDTATLMFDDKDMSAKTNLKQLSRRLFGCN